MSDTPEIGEFTEADIRKALKVEVDAINEGRNKGIQVDGDTVTVDEKSAEALSKHIKRAGELSQYLEATRMYEKAHDLLSEDEAKALGASISGQTIAPKYETSDISGMFVKSDEFQAMQSSKSMNMSQPWHVETYDLAGGLRIEQKDVYTGSVSDAVNPLGFGGITDLGIVPRPHRMNRVRDLFPVAATSSNLITFIRVSGMTNNAAEVSERTGDDWTTKPQSDLTFEAVNIPVSTVAHWVPAHRNTLDDEPGLRAIINNELLYGLKLREDYALLQGDGTGSNVLGLLNTPGIQIYTAANDELYTDTLRKAATLVELANASSTGYVLHPNDWEKVEIQKPGSGGDGQYMIVTNVSIGASQRIWRQPVVSTAAMPEHSFLTGAWGYGVQLYDRMDANIRISEHNGTNFVQNAITILAEERLALVAKIPSSIVKGTFDT